MQNEAVRVAVEKKPTSAFLLGSLAPELSADAARRFQSRLWRVSGIVFVGVLIFLIRDYFANVQVHDRFLWAAHITAVGALGCCFLLLNPRRTPSQRALLAAEKAVFVAPAALLLAMQRQVMLIEADRGFVHDPTGPWLILMMAYALFIPTTLRRAAWILGSMAVAPLALIAGGMIIHPTIRQAWGFEETSRVTLCMAFGVGALLYGTSTLGALRKEAYKARRLGQYLLRERIGSGGMGEVYLAEHQFLKRPCAIKLIPPSRAEHPLALTRFEREVTITASLSHPNTVEIYDYGRTEDGVFYYVMEHLTGKNLGELVALHGPLPPERVIYLLRQVCGALNEAHSIGFVHRDVKPANIFASICGGVHDVAKLLDFGLVKPASPSEDPSQTVAGSITGSPLFMSPEQAAGEAIPDARSDIYSVGACAYYLLTGRAPFEHPHPMRIILAHLDEEPTPPSSLLSSVPEDLEKVVLKCLEKSPAMRFQSVKELADAFDECEAAGDWDAKRAEEWWSRHEYIHDVRHSPPSDVDANTVTHA